VFSLTVPTGGGKTIASIFFALRHIQLQNAQQTDPHRKLRRIIVVIPYLNITQQTARELQDVFQRSEQDPVVLEHHSQAQDPPLDQKQVEQGKQADYSRQRTMRQLAAENWDAPIVVTTSVQSYDCLLLGKYLLQLPQHFPGGGLVQRSQATHQPGLVHHA
jgi:CRISPR-associated endonuclease/helicase Cas3